MSNGISPEHVLVTVRLCDWREVTNERGEDPLFAYLAFVYGKWLNTPPGKPSCVEFYDFFGKPIDRIALDIEFAYNEANQMFVVATPQRFSGLIKIR